MFRKSLRKSSGHSGLWSLHRVWALGNSNRDTGGIHGLEPPLWGHLLS